MTSPTPTCPFEAPAVTIRVATTADAPALRTVIARADDQYQDALSPDLFAAYLADLVDVERRANEATILVAEADGDVVGTVSLYADASRASFGWPAGWSVIRALAVEPTHRGRGTARRLVEECIEMAAGGGAPVIGLHTATLMTAAVRLYERLGFIRDAAHDVAADDVMGIAADDAPAIIAYRLELAHPIDSYALGRSNAETAPTDAAAPDLRADHGSLLRLGRGHARHAGARPGQRGRRRGVGAGRHRRPGGQRRRRRCQRGDPGHGAGAVAAAGFTNVEFRGGDIRQLDLAGDFDAVVGRWILMYLDDPADVIRRAARMLRPGGIVAFMESADLAAPVRAHPPTPLHDLVIRWTTPPPGCAGPDARHGAAAAPHVPRCRAPGPAAPPRCPHRRRPDVARLRTTSPRPCAACSRCSSSSAR